jgi:hypothetical protein
MTQKVMVFIMGKPTVTIRITSLKFLLILAIMRREFLKSGHTILIGVDSFETDVSGAFRSSAYTGP